MLTENATSMSVHTVWRDRAYAFTRVTVPQCDDMVAGIGKDHRFVVAFTHRSDYRCPCPARELRCKRAYRTTNRASSPHSNPHKHR